MYLKELVQGKAIRSAELEERSAYFDDPVNRKLTRATHRAYLRLPVPVEDVNDSSNKGFITDLSGNRIPSQRNCREKR